MDSFSDGGNLGLTVIEKRLLAIGSELMEMVEALPPSSDARIGDGSASERTEEAFLAVVSLAKAHQHYIQWQEALAETERQGGRHLTEPVGSFRMWHHNSKSAIRGCVSSCPGRRSVGIIRVDFSWLAMVISIAQTNRPWMCLMDNTSFTMRDNNRNI